jgi:hypothetical protein
VTETEAPPKCIRCGGTEDLMDRAFAPGMTYCSACREALAVQLLGQKPRDWGYEAQQSAEAHVDACQRWCDYFEEGEPEDELPAGEDPSCGPYCGCTTCIIRETLHAAWPVIEEGIRSGDFD